MLNIIRYTMQKIIIRVIKNRQCKSNNTDYMKVYIEGYLLEQYVC